MAKKKSSAKPPSISISDFLDQQYPSAPFAEFTPAEAFAAAQELKRHLDHWHIEDNRSPLHTTDEAGSHDLTRRIFHSTLAETHGRRPVSIQVFPGEVPGGSTDGDIAGSAYINPGRLTNKGLTRWLVRDFYERLSPLREQQLWRHLALTFDRLLGEVIYSVREPLPEIERACVAAGLLIVIGRELDPVLLDEFVEAAHTVHAASLHSDQSTKNPARCPLTIEDHNVILDGEVVSFDLTAEAKTDAVDYLRILIDRWPDWVSDSDVNKVLGNRGCRWDRLRPRLPDAVKAIIETNRRKGSRINLLSQNGVDSP